MKLPKFVLPAVLVIVGFAIIVVGVGMFLPRSVSVERQTTISAPQETVFAVVNSLRAFQKWSPWANLDPALAVTYEGPDAGVGQKMSWVSKKRDIGSGSQTITESTQGEHVASHIDLGEMGSATAILTLSPAEGGTTVAWRFTSDKVKGPIAPYFLLMAKGSVAKDYERGLANLKAFAEKLPKIPLEGVTAEHVTVVSQPVIRMRTSSEQTAADMDRALAFAYGALTQTLATQHLEKAGPSLSIGVGVEGQRALFDAAIPIKVAPAGDLPAGIISGMTYEGDAIQIIHHGSYDGLPAEYPKLLIYALVNGWDVSGPSWNEYVSDPATTAADQLETHIYLPVK
jgi:effector-binding domain-containing protein